MMKKTVDRRLALALFIVAILVLCQFVPQKQNSKLINCSLVDSSQTAERFRTSYGLPLPVVGTYTTTNCSQEPTTQISSFSIEGLLVDILFVIVLGALSYWFFSVWRRSRLRNIAE